MPEYNVSKLKLPNGVVLNLPGGASYDQLNTSEIDGVNYDYMSQDAMVVSPQDLAYLISYVSGNMLGDPLPDNADLNNYAGFNYEFRSYYTDNANNTISNVPTNISTNVALTRKFKLICSHINTGNYMQIIIPTDAVDNSVLTNPPLTSLFYIRFKISSTWTSWKEIGNFWWLTTIDSLQWGSDTHLGQNQGRQLTITFQSETNGSPVEDAQGMAQIFYIPFGDSSSSGLVRTSSQAVTSAPSSSSSTTSHTVPTQLGLYNSLHDVGNALTLQNIGTGTDDTTAYTITSSRLAYAVQAHDHLVDFKPASTDPLVYDNTNKKLTLNADMDYYYRDSTGHPGGVDLDIESTGYLEIPYGNGTNPGVLKLSSAAATSSSASGNSDYTAATPKAVYDSIHSSSNAATTSTYGPVKIMDVSIVTTADSRYSDQSVATAKCVYDSIHNADNHPTVDNSNSYGVVRVSSSYNISQPGDADKNYVANTYAVAMTYNYAKEAYTLANSANTAATTTASTSDYGVTILSNSYTNTGSSYKSYAATAYAVGKVNEKVNDKMDQPTFISSLLFTSSISSYKYAFSVFNGIAVLNFTATVGTAISSGSIKTILTSSGYIPSSYRPTYAVGFLASVYNDSSDKWDFVTAYVNSNGAIYIRPTTTIAVGDTIRGSVTWTYDSYAWETG